MAQIGAMQALVRGTHFASPQVAIFEARWPPVKAGTDRFPGGSPGSLTEN